MCDQHVVYSNHKANFLNRNSHFPVVGSHFPHEAGWATVLNTGRNALDNLFSHGDWNQNKLSPLSHGAGSSDEIYRQNINTIWIEICYEN